MTTTPEADPLDDPTAHPLAGHSTGHATGASTGGASVPARCATLPRDDRGWPIPWHQLETDDPDADPTERYVDAVRFDRCYTCGQHRGRHVTFLVPPSGAIVRLSLVPPSHVDCAAWEATTLHAPDGQEPLAWAVWTTRTWEAVPVAAPGGGQDRVGFYLGDPERLVWRYLGQPATADQVAVSLARAVAEFDAAEDLGPDAHATVHQVAARLAAQAEASA